MYLDRDCRTEVALRNEIIVAILSHLEMKSSWLYSHT